MNNLFKLILTPVLTLLPCAMMMAQTEIWTAEELAAIGMDKSAMEQLYILMNDIAVEKWIPIGGIDGDDEGGFSGIFDGNGHTITIHSFDEELDNTQVGLFGLIEEKGVVKNLRITGEVSYTGSQQVLCIGAFTGLNKGLITCCVSAFDLTCGYARPEDKKEGKAGLPNGQHGGGIAGVNHGSITHCYSTGSIRVLQGQAAGIAGINGNVVEGSFGISIGPGGVGMTSRPPNLAKQKGDIFYCYSTASVSAAVDNSGRGMLNLISGGAGGIASTTNTTHIRNCVSLNRSIEAKGDLTKASPFPVFGQGRMIKGAFWQFFYRGDIVVHRYNGKNAKLKPPKLPPKKAVDFARTQQESWWRLPEGLSEKEKKNVPGFLFGSDESSPWKWDDDRKQPVLYWE